MCRCPWSTAFQATQRIRALGEPVASLPIVALTANVYAEQVASFLGAGMNDHLGKPIERRKLLSTVGRWLQKAGEHRAQASDRTRRQTLDRDVYRELVELMGQSGSAKMLAQFNELLAALPDLAPTDLDRQALAKQAHKLVSAAGMLGFRVSRRSAASSRESVSRTAMSPKSSGGSDWRVRKSCPKSRC